MTVVKGAEVVRGNGAGSPRPHAAHLLDVGALMVTPAPAVRPDQALARAAELMDTHRCRTLPVVLDRRLVGVVTRDLVDLHRGNLEWTPVRSAMALDPAAVTVHDRVADVVRLLVGHGFDAVPVLDGGGVVVGLVRADRLLELLANGC